MEDEDLEAIPFTTNQDVLSGAQIKRSFVPEKRPDLKSPWTSLEIAKLLVAMMTPLLIAGIGIYATKQSHDQDVARTAREVFDARKAAVGPIAESLAEQARSFSVALRADIYEYQSAKSLPAHNRVSERIEKNIDRFKSKAMSDFSRLRVPIANNSTFIQLRNSFFSAVDMRIVRAKSCGTSGSRDDAECATHQLAAISSCADIVAIAIESFDSLPITVPSKVLDECRIDAAVAVPG